MKSNIDIKDMWKLLGFQTIIYTLLYLIYYTDGLTSDGKIIWKPLIITFYSLSVLVTFIIPIVKNLTQFKNNKEIEQVKDVEKSVDITDVTITETDISDTYNNPNLPENEYFFEIKGDIRNFTQEEFANMLNILGQVGLDNFAELVKLYENRYGVKR